MLTIWVEIIKVFFITNFKASEHPIISNILRGGIVAFLGVVFFIYMDVTTGRESNLLFGLAVSITAGAIVTVFLIFMDFLEKL